MWLHHPITRIVMQHYLPDFRTALERQTVDAWMNGRTTLKDEQEARGYLLTIALIERLNLDQVRVFYGLEATWAVAEEQAPLRNRRL